MPDLCTRACLWHGVGMDTSGWEDKGIQPHKGIVCVCVCVYVCVVNPALILLRKQLL